jgi:hypothetical protein
MTLMTLRFATSESGDFKVSGVTRIFNILKFLHFFRLHLSEFPRADGCLA